MEASVLLCETLCGKLTDCTENSVNVIAETVSSILCALDVLTSGNAGAHQEVTDKTLKSLSGALHKWITDKRVIGSSAFGNPVPPYLRQTFNWKGEEELKVIIL